MTQEKAIPAPGSWGTKKDGEEVVVFRVGEVDPVKEDLILSRFIRFLDGGVPLFGRVSRLSFKTWRTNRYSPCEAPVPPLPAMLDRYEAETRLLALGMTGEAVWNALWQPAAFKASDDPRGAEAAAIVTAHAAYLDDAHAKAEATAGETPEEPTVADVLASNAAVRAEMSEMRAELRALVVALRERAPQLGLPFQAAA